MLLLPTIATMDVRNVVPKGTGIHEPSGNVSPTREGLLELKHDCVDENSSTMNCSGTLLSGVELEVDIKSSICRATAYRPAEPPPLYVMEHYN